MKKLMALKSFVVSAALVCGVLSPVLADSTFWLFEPARKRLSKDGAVVGAITVDNANRTLRLASTSESQTTKVYPEDGVLDFSYPVQDAVSNAWTIVSISEKAYSTEWPLKMMILPETLTSLGAEVFNNNGATAPLVVPKFPASLISFGTKCCRSLPFSDDKITIGANGDDVTIGDSCFACGDSAYNVIDTITFGSGTVTMNQTDVFYKRRVKTIVIGGDLVVGEKTFNGMVSYVTRIFVPPSATQFTAALDALTHTAWKDDTRQADYFAVHGQDAEAPDYRVKVGREEPAEIWILNRAPVSDKGSVTVSGECDGQLFQQGMVSPAYGSQSNYELKDLPIAFAAEEKTVVDGVRYACVGCRLEKYVGGVWQPVETKSDVLAYSFEVPDIDNYRVVWLWAVDAYPCTVQMPTGSSDVLSFETTGIDGEGFALAGSTVTLRAISADPTIPFCFWAGNVTFQDKASAETSFVVTGKATVCPCFRTPWSFSGDAASGLITDGYWTFKTVGESAALTIAKNDTQYPPTIPWFGGFLDLSKPIAGGGEIVALGNEAFHYCTEITDVVLPKHVKSIGDHALDTKSTRLGSPRLVSVTPCLPSSVTNLGEYALANANGNPVKLTGELVWRPKSVATLGLEQQFGDQGFTKVTFGKNVRTVTPFMFVRSTSIKELYFEGDVPEFQKNPDGYNAFYGWGSKQATIYVPRGNASWLKWLEENTLPSCWKEVQFYNPDTGLKLVIQ